MADQAEPKGVNKPVVEQVSLTREELQNLINVVSSHPTPSGVGGQEGQEKIRLINKLTQMLKIDE